MRLFPVRWNVRVMTMIPIRLQLVVMHASSCGDDISGIAGMRQRRLQRRQLPQRDWSILLAAAAAAAAAWMEMVFRPKLAMAACSKGNIRRKRGRNETRGGADAQVPDASAYVLSHPWCRRKAS
jgi:hypothetical protein